MLPVAVVRSYFEHRCNVLPVLWMTPCFHIMGHIETIVIIVIKFGCGGEQCAMMSRGGVFSIALYCRLVLYNEVIPCAAKTV